MSKYHDAMKKLFDTQREGKGVDKGPKTPQNFSGFLNILNCISTIFLR